MTLAHRDHFSQIRRNRHAAPAGTHSRDGHASGVQERRAEPASNGPTDGPRGSPFSEMRPLLSASDHLQF